MGEVASRRRIVVIGVVAAVAIGGVAMIALVSPPGQEPAIRPASTSSDRAAEALGCDPAGNSGAAEYGFAQTFTCWIEGEFVRVHEVRAEDRGRALALLAMRADPRSLVPCPDGSLAPTHRVVDGGEWIAVAAGEAAAAAIVDRVGGTPQPVGEGEGPPVSYKPTPC